MMRALFWLVAVFAAAVALALRPRRRGLRHRGLSAVAARGVAAFQCARAGGGVRRRLCRAASGEPHAALPAQVRAYASGAARPGADALAAALQCYFEGRYARAEKEAALAWEAGAAPGIAALIAARAAHQMREYERRGQWLERAEAAGESLHAARLLTQAELALDERDFTGARDALRSLHGTGPRISRPRMQLRAERGAQNWEEVLRLARCSPSAARCRGDRARAPVQAHLELLARRGRPRLAGARLRRIRRGLCAPARRRAAARRAGGARTTPRWRAN
jgi:HemY protein